MTLATFFSSILITIMNARNMQEIFGFISLKFSIGYQNHLMNFIEVLKIRIYVEFFCDYLKQTAARRPY